VIVDLRKIQAEHKVWVDQMFPKQPAEIPAAGMVEEAGELLHCILARRRGMLWGFEPRYPVDKVQADLEDAVGDCAIYFCSLCNAMNWSFDELDPPAAHPQSRRIVQIAVDLVRTAAECFTDRRKDWGLYYVGLVKLICEQMDLDYYRCVQETWNRVKERRRESGNMAVLQSAEEAGQPLPATDVRSS
jgi:NTP pyrophosphatase (non-canonical NTP hydrolase)